MAKGALIQPSFYEAMKVLPDDERLQLFDAICEYSLNGNLPSNLPAMANSQFILMKPNIDASAKRYNASVKNGQKGGAPRGNQNASKQPKNNQTTQPKNKQDIDYDYDYDSDVDLDCNVGRPDNPPPRHEYGSYKNVLFTNEEYTKLQAEFPNDYLDRIERLSEYMASLGKSYKNHLATIRSWARKDSAKACTMPNYGGEENWSL